MSLGEDFGFEDAGKEIGKGHPTWRLAYLTLWHWGLISTEDLEVIFRHADLSPPTKWELESKNKALCARVIEFLVSELARADKFKQDGMSQTSGNPWVRL